MRVDHEAVLTDLSTYIASKTSHGRGDLLVKLAELADEHKVPEDLLERAARLVGSPIHTHRPEAEPASTADREIDEGMASEPPATDDQGGHDGRTEDRSRTGDPVRA